MPRSTARTKQQSVAAAVDVGVQLLQAPTGESALVAVTATVVAVQAAAAGQADASRAAVPAGVEAEGERLLRRLETAAAPAARVRAAIAAAAAPLPRLLTTQTECRVWLYSSMSASRRFSGKPSFAFPKPDLLHFQS